MSSQVRLFLCGLNHIFINRINRTKRLGRVEGVAKSHHASTDLQWWFANTHHQSKSPNPFHWSWGRPKTWSERCHSEWTKTQRSYSLCWSFLGAGVVEVWSLALRQRTNHRTLVAARAAELIYVEWAKIDGSRDRVTDWANVHSHRLARGSDILILKMHINLTRFITVW